MPAVPASVQKPRSTPSSWAGRLFTKPAANVFAPLFTSVIKPPQSAQAAPSIQQATQPEPTKAVSAAAEVKVTGVTAKPKKTTDWEEVAGKRRPFRGTKVKRTNAKDALRKFQSPNPFNFLPDQGGSSSNSDNNVRNSKSTQKKTFSQGRR